MRLKKLTLTAVLTAAALVMFPRDLEADGLRK